ncbi:MAG: hypothetical protein ACRD0G_06885, partial [Acidimicrobiales bacterium]
LRGGGAPVASCQWLPPVFPIDGEAATKEASAAAEELLWRSWRRHDEHELLGVSCSYGLGVDAAGSFHPWPAGAEAGPMGWAPWPDALLESLHRLADELPGRELLVASTGAWDTDDERRGHTLRGLHDAVSAAVVDRIPLRGCLWWSAVDGYEGRAGFDVRAGLFDRDRNPGPYLPAPPPNFGSESTSQRR